MRVMVRLVRVGGFEGNEWFGALGGVAPNV